MDPRFAEKQNLLETFACWSASDRAMSAGLRQEIGQVVKKVDKRVYNSAIIE